MGNGTPWLQGIVDGLLGAEVLRSSRILHRNRLAVILYDAAFETACRTCLRHKKKIKLTEDHRHRGPLMKAMQANLPDIDQEVWQTIDYYYEEIRCDFYHQSASKTITDTALAEYQDAVYFVIDRAFDIQVASLIGTEQEKLRSEADDDEGPRPIPWKALRDKIDRVVAGVNSVRPRNVEELNAFFKRQGIPERLSGSEFTAITGRNNGTKKYFFFDRTEKKWQISQAGQDRLDSLKEKNQ